MSSNASFSRKMQKLSARRRGAKGAKRQSTKRVKVVKGYTRTAGAYARTGIVEKKYVDTFLSTAGVPASVGLDTAMTLPLNVASTTYKNSLNLLAQGLTDQTRLGNKITVTNINVHLAFQPQNHATGGINVATCHNRVRVVLYVDKQFNGGTANASAPANSNLEWRAIFANGEFGATPGIADFRNMDSLDRFVILKDKTYTLAPAVVDGFATSAAVFMRKTIAFSIKCKIPIQYGDTTSTIQMIKSNNISIMVLNGGGSVTNFSGVVRCKYLDL